MTLTSYQRKQLARLIERRRHALLAEVREDAARVQMQPYSAQADLEQADMTRDVGDLRELESALERWKAGRYGVCADCGADIAYARLKAAPAALRCAPCQERHEKTFAGTARPTL
jgi:DnaK suppressor protein